MKFLKTKELPPVASEAIRECVNDVKIVAKEQGYRINFWKWHSSELLGAGEYVCEVCLGGATLARMIDNRYKSITPSCDEAIKRIPNINRIEAMDAFRYLSLSQIHHGLRVFYGREVHITTKLVNEIIDLSNRESLAQREKLRGLNLREMNDWRYGDGYIFDHCLHFLLELADLLEGGGYEFTK